jgi:hypothetical protein
MTNAQKTPLSRTLPRFAQNVVRTEIAKRGRSLPCRVDSVDGPIVTVNFEVSGLTLPKVTMPLFGSEYVRLPIQPGCLGVTFPCDVYIGNVSGLGGGQSDDSLRGNLSTLVFFPIGNTNWSAVDPNAVTIYGPNGVALMDSAGHTKAILTPAGLAVTAQTSISLTVGSHNITIDSAGVHIDGRIFLAHQHSGIQTGGSNSAGVV